MTRVQLAWLWLRLVDGAQTALIPGVAESRRTQRGIPVYRRCRGESWTGWVRFPAYAAVVADQCWPPGWDVPEVYHP